MTVRPVLLYDAGCRVCRFAARCVARVDREQALDILPLEDPDAAALLAPLREDERLATWRLVSPEGAVPGYGAGVPQLLSTMRLTRPLGRMLGLVPGEALDRVYGVLARNRSRLGKLVPDGPAPRRLPRRMD